MRVDALVPDWPVSPRVRALVTLRTGGMSRGPYAAFNLAAHVGDRAEDVAANREALRCGLGLAHEPWWLNQVHGTRVIDVDVAGTRRGQRADGAITRRAGRVLCVLTADCLPIFFAERQGRAIAVVHAGWRGLAAGIIECAVEQLAVDPSQLCAWIGPGIGAAHYQVGDQVKNAFAEDGHAHKAFVQVDSHHWQADLAMLATLRLGGCGLREVYASGACTFEEPQKFYSYRRDGVTGRMASLIWIDR